MEHGGGPSAALGDFGQAPLSYPMPEEHQVGLRGKANSSRLWLRNMLLHHPSRGNPAA